MNINIIDFLGLSVMPEAQERLVKSLQDRLISCYSPTNYKMLRGASWQFATYETSGAVGNQTERIYYFTPTGVTYEGIDGVPDARNIFFGDAEYALRITDDPSFTEGSWFVEVSALTIEGNSPNTIEMPLFYCSAAVNTPEKQEIIPIKVPLIPLVAIKIRYNTLDAVSTLSVSQHGMFNGLYIEF